MNVAVWSMLAWRAGLALLVGLLAGLLFGGLAWWLAAAALGTLGWVLFGLYGFEQWLLAGRRRSAAAGTGVWAPLYSSVIRLRRQARRRKRRYHRLLREVRASTEAMYDGGVLLTPALDIVGFNQAAARLLDLDPVRDQGQSLVNLLRHPDFVAYVNGGRYERPVQVPGPHRDTHLSLQLIPYGAGQRLLMVRDVTREVRLERMRRDFVANASHELRSPLTVIGGYLEGLSEDERLDAGWREPVEEMRRQVQRMNAIVRDLITLTRLESAERAAGDTPVDVPGMLQGMHREAQDRRQRPREVELGLEAAVWLRGEEQELHSIFSNLLNNALRFTPPEGSVHCRWEADETGARFTVTDTGIGIPEELIPRITERFFRVDSGRAREVGGTGLGLAIVKHALARHGGTLEISSEPGSGSTFLCRFPAARVVSAPVRKDGDSAG